MTTDRAALVRARAEAFIVAAEDYRIKSETVLLDPDEGAKVTLAMLRARDDLRDVLSLLTAEPERLCVFIDPNGCEVARETQGAIELRSSGAGWPWMDFDGREWGSAGAPRQGELLPRWVVRRRAPTAGGAVKKLTLDNRCGHGILKTQEGGCKFCRAAVAEPAPPADRRVCTCYGLSNLSDCPIHRERRFATDDEAKEAGQRVVEKHGEMLKRLADRPDTLEARLAELLQTGGMTDAAFLYGQVRGALDTIAALRAELEAVTQQMEQYSSKWVRAYERAEAAEAALAERTP